jgi:1-acyl-sn-glycerol-3-phosphate acyltransferase
VDPDRSYDEALAEGQRINAGVRIGKPGRARAWPLAHVLFPLLRVKVKLDMSGQEHVAPGPAILVSNHKSMLDPVVTVLGSGWDVTAFTKAEAYESPVRPFFSLLGQIPLRRGDDESTEWALDMARRALADGGKVGIYPEGTRGPDHGSLYRLAQRVLVPLLQSSPDVPVHAVTVAYDKAGFRTGVTVRVSERLPLDARSMSGPELTAVIRDRLVELGGLDYVDQYAFVLKAKAKRAAEAAAAGEPGPPAGGPDRGEQGPGGGVG